MTSLNCEYVRDIYPDVLNGTAEAALAQRVREHVASCDECCADAALLHTLHGQLTRVPVGLHERVVRRARQSRVRRRFSRADLAMAATLVVALIGGSVFMQSRQQNAGPPRTAGADALVFGFVGVEEILLSGKASLADLSVEELETLLGEMES